ncbi:arginase family protein [Pontibacter sp. G13]|uniref:arginase family protein n=1 Tax=Pontibacter sp. G13 TaxID=3074898 RepID=UPI00288A43EC|nr:arginase family protein [Pontibacter sp. G13]WNJ18901.1 arginase family protein [Pontibacter sp. G13]
MDLSPFFESLNLQEPRLNRTQHQSSWWKQSLIHLEEFPDWRAAEIILIGCPERRGADRGPNTPDGLEAIRKALYKLVPPIDRPIMADLGNLIPKDSPQETYDLLGFAIQQLQEAGKRVLIIGGSQDLTIGQFSACDALQRKVEYVHIDSKFDLLDPDIALNNETFNQFLLDQYGHLLLTLTNLGYQRYYTPDSQRQYLRELNHYTVRYGDLSGQMAEAEPYLRTADIVSLDMGAIRNSEAPGTDQSGPGGFSAVEICQMVRYAGIGYRCNSLLISEFDHALDRGGQTADLIALMIWYFVEGHCNRKDDYPRPDRSNLRKYSVQLHASIDAIHFFKHPESGRWWMEVPLDPQLGAKKSPCVIVPCSEKDYQFAKTDDIPDRWWLTYNKLS